MSAKKNLKLLEYLLLIIKGKINSQNCEDI